MKRYTIVSRLLDGQTSNDVINLLTKMVDDVECLYEDGEHARLRVTVDDDFNYAHLENHLDENGNKCEFIDADYDLEADMQEMLNKLSEAFAIKVDGQLHLIDYYYFDGDADYEISIDNEESTLMLSDLIGTNVQFFKLTPIED